MKKINIELQIDEINTIIEALGQLPFVKVYKIIEKIHIQANTQIDKNLEKTIELNKTPNKNQK